MIGPVRLRRTRHWPVSDEGPEASRKSRTAPELPDIRFVGQCVRPPGGEQAGHLFGLAFKTAGGVACQVSRRIVELRHVMMHGMERVMPRRKPFAPPADPRGLQQMDELFGVPPRQARYRCASARVEYPDAVPGPASPCVDPLNVPEGDFRGPEGMGQSEDILPDGGGLGVPGAKNRAQEGGETGSPDRKAPIGVRSGIRRVASGWGGPCFPICHCGPHMPWSGTTGQQ